MGRKAERLTSLRLRHALDLVDDAPGLDDGHPLLDRALTFTLASFERLFGERACPERSEYIDDPHA